MGIKTGIEYAQKLGLTGELPPYLPLAIGAGEATPQEMASAFATFANQGLRMKPMYITRITDRDGNIDRGGAPGGARRHPRRHRLHHDAACCKGVVERGTAARARALKRPIAGKTGTTNDFTDGWFVGFEPAPGRRGVGRLRREGGQPGPRRRTARARRCRSGWSSGRRP